MSKAFKCKSCGTRYTTTGNKVPPAINWDDGHKCVLIEINEDEMERRMNIIGQNGNDGLHYDREEDDKNG